MNTKLMFSSASDDWSTPQDVYDKLNAEFLFTDDPCPLGGTDGLERAWGGIVFVNPPYSNVKGFMEKALQEMLRQNTHTAVFLVPSRTDTKWWHSYVLPYAKEIRFIKGRLKFGGFNKKGEPITNSAPFPSCIIVFERSDKLGVKNEVEKR